MVSQWSGEVHTSCRAFANHLARALCGLAPEDDVDSREEEIELGRAQLSCTLRQGRFFDRDDLRHVCDRVLRQSHDGNGKNEKSGEGEKEERHPSPRENSLLFQQARGLRAIQGHPKRRKGCAGRAPPYIQPPSREPGMSLGPGRLPGNPRANCCLMCLM